MSTLAQRVYDLKARTNLAHTEVFSHFSYTYVDQAPAHIRRIMAQVEYALSLLQAQAVASSAPLAAAIDCLEGAMQAHGSITQADAGSAEAALSPYREAAKQYRVHMVAHAHIDMDWQWARHETVAVTLETFRTILRLMAAYPSLTFSQSQASCYQIVEEYDPDMLAEIKERIREGRWEVSASTWVEADKNMPTAESMARHLLYTKQYLGRLLDVDPSTLDLDFEPDTFGHSANVPEILSQGGVRYYYHCRGYDGHIAYRWRAPSGAEVLVFREPLWYLGDITPDFAMTAPAFAGQMHGRDVLEVYGVGDHGGGPTERDIRLILEMQQWPIFPELIFSSYKAFFQALDGARDRLPVVEGELNTVFSGCYTTQCCIKAGNRIGEAMLTEAETLASAAQLLAGAPYQKEVFEKAWQLVLYNQFHDILPGSCVRSSRECAMGNYSRAYAAGGTAYATAIRALSAQIDTPAPAGYEASAYNTSEGAGVGLSRSGTMLPAASRGNGRTRIFHLFNPDQQARDDVTEITVWDWPGDPNQAQVVDMDGTVLPSQWLGDRPRQAAMNQWQTLLVKCRVPAFGWTTIILQETPRDRLSYGVPGDPRVHRPDRYVLENERIQAVMDVQTGWLTSLLDKGTGESLLAEGAACGFTFIEEDPVKGMSSWVVGRYLRREMLREARIQQLHTGPLGQSIEVRYAFGQRGSTLTAVFSLDQDSDSVRIQTTCDWREVGTAETTIAQLAFIAPLQKAFAKARYAIPGGAIERGQEAQDAPTLGLLVPALDEPGKTVALAADTKYGMRADENALQVTLIRAAFSPDPLPDLGEHQFCLSLTAIASDDLDAQLSLPQHLLRPVYSQPVTPHAGTLPQMGSFFQIEGEGIRFSGLKQAEGSSAYILRLYNAAGDAGRAKITFLAPIKQACVTDILETASIKDAQVDGHAVYADIAAHAMLNLRIAF